MSAGVAKLILKIIAASLLTLFVIIAAFLYMSTNGVPFIEGDNKITSGAYAW